MHCTAQPGTTLPTVLWQHIWDWAPWNSKGLSGKNLIISHTWIIHHTWTIFYDIFSAGRWSPRFALSRDLVDCLFFSCLVVFWFFFCFVLFLFLFFNKKSHLIGMCFWSEKVSLFLFWQGKICSSKWLEYVNNLSFHTKNFWIQLKILMSTSKILLLKAYKASKLKQCKVRNQDSVDLNLIFPHRITVKEQFLCVSHSGPAREETIWTLTNSHAGKLLLPAHT